MRINMSSIMDKVNAYADSKSGAEKKSNCINEYVQNGVRTTKSGGTIITLDEMVELADFLIFKIIVNTSGIIPGDVRNLIIEDLCVMQSPIYMGKNENGIDMYELGIGFKNPARLRRSSLSTRPYYQGTDPSIMTSFTGNGIDNIVSLFDTGYSTDVRKFGYWNPYETDTIVHTANRLSREPLGFIESSIIEFNNSIGKRYGCTAYISADDDYYFRILPSPF